MPLYEYECDACGHRFEVIQKFSDAPIDKCPACGSTVHKMQSAPAFHLKGTGWYATDYAKSGSGGESKGGKDGKKSEGASGSADSSSSGDKPASGDTGSTTAPSSSGAPASTVSSTGSPKPETPKT
jgi:putative FmdB family regulatory protein